MSDSRVSCDESPRSRTDAKHSDEPKLSPFQSPFRFRDPQSPFRFCDLPFEMRNEIYGLCLISNTKIDIEAEHTVSVPHRHNINNGDGPIKLKHTHKGQKRPSHINFNLLLIDKATFKEAAPLLYRHSEFRFRNPPPQHLSPLDKPAWRTLNLSLTRLSPRRHLSPPDNPAWRTLNLFLTRISSSSHICLRRLDLPFPAFDPHMEDSLDDAWTIDSNILAAAEALARLPMLETLTLRLDGDLVLRDLKALRWIDGFQGGYNVVLEVHERLGVRDGEAWGAVDEECRVVVDAAAVRLFRSCGWEIRGEFATILRRQGRVNLGKLD